MNRTAVGSTAGVVLIGALLLRMPMPGPRTPASGAHASRQSHISQQNQNVQLEAGIEFPEDGPWKASQDYYGAARPDRKECLASETTPENRSRPAAQRVITSQGEKIPIVDLRDQLWCIPDNETVQAMIATVPDPVHTRLPLVFDRSIEAIQLAAQANGYAPDRYWLAWDPEGEPEWKDYESRRKAEQETEEKEEQPGVLMFRWNGMGKSATKVLYVFIVAETPTTGLNGQQFRNAVNYVQTLCSSRTGSPHCASPERIRIFGPTFSGSLISLLRLTSPLKKPDGTQQLFTAYSGTVSSSSEIEKQGLPYSCKERSPCPLIFRTFVHDTESAIKLLVLDAMNNGEIKCKGRPEVAVLTETNTAYGSASSAGSSGSSNTNCVTNFSYPREISSVRNAYNNSDAPKESTTGNAAAQEPFLHFNLRDQNPNTHDEPPDFSQQQGPLSKEATLMKISAELHNQHYKYIGVIGTNVLDVMFLSSFLRKSYPDARIFVTNSDLLFERDLDNAPYIGTVALSTYPLVTRNLDWSAPGQNRQRLSFADQYEEGQYNAAVLVIQEMLAGELKPDRRIGPLPYELPPWTKGSTQQDLDNAQAHKITPPLWLSVVGTGGYWPVKILYEKTDGTPATYSLEQQDFSPGWRSAVAILIIFSLLVLVALFRASPLSHIFGDFSATFDASGQRLPFIHLCTACLFFCLMMLIVPVSIYGHLWDLYGWHTSGWYVWSISLTALGFALALLLSSVLVQANFLRNRPWLMKQDRVAVEEHWFRELFLTWLLPSIWWLGAIAGLICWWRLFHHADDNYGFFFAYRVVHFASGVSPVVPMFPLLAAMFLWAIFEMMRLRMDERFRPRLNSPDFFPGWDVETPIAFSVNRFLLERKYVLAFLLTFLLWLPFFNLVHPFELFEHYSFGRLFEVMFCAVIAMMLSAACRLNQAWENLKPLLQELERSRLRLSFNRLKGFGWSPIWKQGGREGDWINIARSLEAIDAVSASSAAVWASSANDQQVEDDIKKIRRGRKNLHEQRKVAPLLFAPLSEDLKTYMRRFAFHLGRIVFRRQKNVAQPQFDQAPVEAVYRLQKEFGGIQQGLATLLNRIANILPGAWQDSPIDPQEDSIAEDEKTAGKEQEEPEAEELQLQRWENYVALRYVAFIRGILAYMRHAMIFLAISFSLVLVSLNLYSFEPHQTLLWSFTALFLIIGVVIVRVLLQVHRDHILSRITDTKPNEAGLEFYLRMVSVGALPLLTLLATHFPSIGRGLLSLFQPGLEALK